MKHVSLFSGIGGFSLACDWAGIETILHCEIDDFCQKVLKKHYPDVPIVKDVNNVEEIKAVVTAYTECRRSEQGHRDSRKSLTIFGSHFESAPNTTDNDRREPSRRGAYFTGLRNQQLLLTAGFPCQPFSNAGRKRGASDNRYLWPHTLKVIEAIRPNYVLLENVAGLLNMVFPDSGSKVASQTSLFSGENDEIADYDTISGGIDRDLRQAGYETLWLVIPACAVSAPHRRDRVWIVCHRNVSDTIRSGCTGNTRRRAGQEFKNGLLESESRALTHPDRSGSGTPQSGDNGIGQTKGEVNGQLSRPELGGQSGDATDPSQQGLQGQQPGQPLRLPGQPDRIGGNEIPNWQENWYEVATRFCRVDDGLPKVLDRVDRLKALGNAIVPGVAYEIIKSILAAEVMRQSEGRK